MSQAERRKKPSLRKRWIAACVLLALAVVGYAYYEYRFPNWKEEVLLPDGRRIVVKQTRDYIRGYGTRRTWLTFSLPEMGGEQTWSEWLYPTMIGSAEGKVYVIGRPKGNVQFGAYSFPRYSYVAFTWSNGKFERISYLSVPENLRAEENIRWCFPGGDDRRIFQRSAGAWCGEKNGASDPFPASKKVDLSVREAEAKFWARLAGHDVGSE